MPANKEQKKNDDDDLMFNNILILHFGLWFTISCTFTHLEL